MNDKQLDRNMKVIYFSIFASLACYFPFLAVFFQDKGLSYTQIGFMFALWSLTSVLVQPVWGFITDKYSYKKATLMLTLGLGAPAIFALLFANSPVTIGLAVVLFFSFNSPIITLMDSYTYEIITKHPGMQYGKIRFFGSLGYAAASLSMGLVVKAFGIGTSFTIFVIVCYIAIAFIKKIEYKGEPNGIRINFKDVGIQLRNKRFQHYILIIAFFSIAFGGNQTYMTILIKQTGGTMFQLGLVGFIIAMSEYPSLQFGTRILRKFGDMNMLVFSMLFYTLRYFLDSVAVSSDMVLAIQALQGLTYPLFLIATYEFISRTTPPNMRTTAMTINAAVMGIGGLIGNIGGGILSEMTGLFVLYKVLAVICFISCFLILGLRKVDQSTENFLEAD